MTSHEPIDIPTAETCSFVASCVATPARILEVGCGAGHVAAALAAGGYDVTAIDASAKAVERARGRGVDARQADWLTYEDDPFDAIIFTRSLHHIFPLEPAVARLRPRLTDGGLVLAEEFALEVFDAPTAAWLTGRAVHLHDDEHLDGDGDSLPRAMLTTVDPPATWADWHGGHEHDLHTAHEIEQALVGHGFAVEVEPAPYLYRYFTACLPGGGPGVAIMSTLLETETNLIRDGGIAPIGRRFTARPAV